MNIKALSIYAIIASLTGCASTSVQPSDKETLVSLKPQIGDQMIARRLDAKPVENLNSFIFKGSNHTLEFGIVMAGNRDSHRRCLATLDYANFEPGGRYALTQTDVARGDVSVSLVDSNGKIVARTSNIPCI